MKKPQTKRYRILRVIGLVIVIGLVLLYLGLPAGMAVYATLSARSEVGEPPPGFEAVTLDTGDNVQLQGWYRQPENGAVIVLLHGASNSRESLRPYAAMLAGNGYGVLALDLRGHGASGGKTNRLGWQGTKDVGAAVSYLQSRSEVSRIGGLGISMGGEILLGAASEYPEIRAIATDGATTRSTADLLAMESERSLVRSFTARVMYSTVSLLTFQRPPKPLVQSITETTSTRYLLIAGGDEPMEIAFNQMYQKLLDDRAAVWIVPGASHTAAFGLYPEEYEQRVIEFFDRVLLAP